MAPRELRVRSCGTSSGLLRNSRSAWTMVVATAVYPIFHSTIAEHLMFGFPELTFVVMGVLVFMGGYTGYRVLDLLRFRAFARPPEGLA